jgi:predicted XRE-type DNA-binding protein
VIKINAKIDTPFFEQLKVASTDGGRKAMSMAINDSLKSGRTTVKREVSQRYNLKQKEIESNSKINKSTATNLKSGKITVASRRLTIGTSTHFSITPKIYSTQKGVKVNKRKASTATIKKKSKEQVKHAFIANPSHPKVKNTMLWIKLNKSGSSIAPLKTISIPQMVTQKDISNNINKSMKEKYEDRFQHYMNRNLNKVKGS